MTATIPHSYLLFQMLVLGDEDVCHLWWFFVTDLCRKQLMGSDGCPVLAGMAWECSVPLPEPLSSRMKCVVCGCLLNACNNNGTHFGHVW